MDLKGISALALLAVALPSACVTSLAQVSDPSRVLTVKSVKFDPSTSFATVEVLNAGDKVITAYSLTYIGGSPMWKDYFPSIGIDSMKPVPGGMRPQAGGMLPGETDTRGLMHGPEQSSDYRVVAVVYEDRTAIGDETEIQRIFDWRSVAAKELSQWCEDLNAAPLRGADRMAAGAAAKALASKMRDAPSGVPGTHEYVTTTGERQGLISVLEQSSRMDDPTMPLQALRSRCAMAPEHAKRATGGVN